jgi:hypothetical protein
MNPPPAGRESRESETKLTPTSPGGRGRRRSQVDANSIDAALHSVADFHQVLLLRIEAFANSRPSDEEMKREVDELLGLIAKSAQRVGYARRLLGTMDIEVSRLSWKDLK